MSFYDDYYEAITKKYQKRCSKSLKKKKKYLFKSFKLIALFILPIISLFQTSEMIKINDAMRVLTQIQNDAEQDTQKLERKNNDALNSFLKSQNEFTNRQSAHLEEMKILDRKRLLILEEERESLREASKPNLLIMSFADVIPVKFQLDSQERAIDNFVKNDESDYRILVRVICINTSANPIALTDIEFNIPNYIDNENIFRRDLEDDEIPFYFYDDHSFMKLKSTKIFPCVLNAHESFDSLFFYECIGKPRVVSGTIKIYTDSKENQYEEDIDLDDDGNLVFSSNVDLDFHPGLSNNESIYKAITNFHNMKKEYQKIKDDINKNNTIYIIDP